MGKKNEVPHLIWEGGQWKYQRRVPRYLQSTLGIKKWFLACGTDKARAVAKVVSLTDEHDALIERLGTPEAQQRYRTEQRRKRETEVNERVAPIQELIDNREQLRPEARAKLEQALAAIRPDWREASRYVADLQRVPDRELQLDRLTDLHQRIFGDAVPPTDPFERDQFDAQRQIVERQIARLKAQIPGEASNTIGKVSERFLEFVAPKPTTIRKYRRHIAELVEEIGDIPIDHVAPAMLRAHRDALSERLGPASVNTHFTAIKGLFTYALEEELIDINPMAGVRLPKDKRPVEEYRWLPFTPNEMTRILIRGQEYWGESIAGLPRERREAFLVLTRVLAYSAMRPIEVMSLQPQDVDDHAIRVRGGKTKSAWRVIPLHPAIKDFPDWLHNGGMETFTDIRTDLVTPLRHNFARLIRKQLTPPIIDKRKALYSLRSTFQNAMRRAGAPPVVPRAILGHVEGGALRHYDDGPEFELKREYIEKTDPTMGYANDTGVQKPTNVTAGDYNG